MDRYRPHSGPESLTNPDLLSAILLLLHLVSSILEVPVGVVTDVERYFVMEG